MPLFRATCLIWSANKRRNLRAVAQVSVISSDLLLSFANVSNDDDGINASKSGRFGYIRDVTSRQLSNSSLPSLNDCAMAVTQDSAVPSSGRIHDERVTHLKPASVAIRMILFSILICRRSVPSE